VPRSQKPTSRSVGLAFVAVVLSTLACSDGAERSDQPEEASQPTNFDELRQSIQEVLDHTNTPGAGIALITRGSAIWVGGVGIADVAAGRLATGETLFRFGSISKSFVSLSVLWLQERGLLDLSDRVRDLAPEIAFKNPWEQAKPVRLVHLLEHTSGALMASAAAFALVWVPRKALGCLNGVGT